MSRMRRRPETDHPLMMQKFRHRRVNVWTGESTPGLATCACARPGTNSDGRKEGKRRAGSRGRKALESTFFEATSTTWSIPLELVHGYL